MLYIGIDLDDPKFANTSLGRITLGFSLDDAEGTLVPMLNNFTALEVYSLAFETSQLSLIENFQELTIPYTQTCANFIVCCFRSLVRLHLSIAPNCGTNVIECDDDLTVNHLIIDFLFAHPTIQDLYWDPFGIPVLPQGLLPFLKHLPTNELVNALLRDNTLIKSRALETITRNDQRKSIIKSYT